MSSCIGGSVRDMPGSNEVARATMLVHIRDSAQVSRHRQTYLEHAGKTTH